MENVIPIEQRVVLSLPDLFPSLPVVDKEMEPDIHHVDLYGICFKIQIILLIIIIVLLYLFKYKNTKTNFSQGATIDDDNCHQKEIYNSFNNNNIEVTFCPRRELQYNISVKFETRKSRQPQKDDEENNCLDSLHFYHDLQIRYNVKRVECESKAQYGGTAKDIQKNLTEDSSDDLHFHDNHEINTSLCSRIKVKNLEFQVSFSKVSSHHPLEINRIPWQRMNKEWWRLHTFSLYPRNALCSSILLARHGFVYIGNGDLDDDTVICVFCLSAAKDLGIDTNIEGLHHSLNPNCPMVKGLDCQNIMIKECDGHSISYILSLLKRMNMNTSSTISGQQYEDQPLPLEADGSEERSHSGVSTTTHNVRNQEFEARAASQNNSNSRVNTSCHQVAENNATYVVVTNCAQSLSLPGSEVTNDSNRIYEAQQLVTPAVVTPATVPDSVPSPKPHSGDSTRRNQTRNSESSRAHTHNNNSHSNNSNSSSHTSRPEVARNSTSSSQEPPENSTSSPPQTVPDSQESHSGNTNSYDKLGIITARPKRPEYAVEITRLNSFEGWPQDHHIKAVDLAKAGYFYTGYSDCARCFYCGGGLRNWEVGDDVWVEHARWFPKCAFMRQIMGQPFIDVVQELNKEKEIIPYEDVIAEMRYSDLENAIPKEIKDKSIELERDAAVMTIIDNGFMKDDTLMAAEKLKDTGQSLSADVLYEELEKRSVTRQSAGIKTDDDSQSISKKGSEKKDQEMFETLKGENSQLRQQSQCKICMDKEVSVVFLPCGHFIACNDCSFALKNCPVCRENIKGVVRAFLK